ncbi:hypothetical protein IMZ48_37905 [Candidatus Bathyarchaeota archaeon]|nr:hypothetical protein [Candidatus Bathyarchaeota archaeon]
MQETAAKQRQERERRDEPAAPILPRASDDDDLEKLCRSMDKTWNGKTGLFRFDCLDIVSNLHCRWTRDMSNSV